MLKEIQFSKELLFLLSLFCWGMMACGGEVAETSKTNKAKEKQEETYHPNGEISEQRSLKNGVLHGKRWIYSEEGHLLIEETYNEGEFEGVYRTFFKDKTIESEGQYIKNAMDGIWKYFYPSGKIKAEVLFKDNEENGPFTEYFESGVVQTKGAFLNGDNEHGNLKKFDEQGELIQEMTCDMGRCSTIYKRD